MAAMDSPTQLDAKTLSMLRLVALVFSVLPVGILSLYKIGYLHSNSYSDLGFYVTSIGLVLLGLVQFFWLPETDIKNRLYLAGYNILGVLVCLFVVGYDTAFIIAWLLIIIGTEFNFGRTAGFLSFALFASSVIAWKFLHPEFPFDQYILVLMEVAFMGGIAFVVARFQHLVIERQHELESSQEQIKFQRERLLALVNSMNAAVVATDTDGRVKIYNAALLSLLDTNDDLSNKPLADVLPLFDQAGNRVTLTELGPDKARSRTDLTYRHREDTMRLYISIAPIKQSYQNETGGGYILVIRDITKEKTLEEEREEFISVVSHELRTPVAIVEGNLSNLKTLKDHRADPALLDRAITSAHEQALYLAKIVNDLSMLSKAEQGIVQPAEDIDVARLLEELYKLHQLHADEKHIKLILDVQPGLPQVQLSRTYITEILQNFISNAFKYTRQGSITLSAKSTGKQLEISIVDTGIGIGRSDQAHMFEKFYRSEDYRTRESSGTGLGLYLSKKLAEKMQIQLTFKSELNHGSRFSVVIPLDQQATNKKL